MVGGSSPSSSAESTQFGAVAQLVEHVLVDPDTILDGLMAPSARTGETGGIPVWTEVVRIHDREQIQMGL